MQIVETVTLQTANEQLPAHAPMLQVCYATLCGTIVHAEKLGEMLKIVSDIL